jgi:hypothetical protein
MSEHVEVSFYTLGDINDDDNSYIQIIESVNKIAGIISIGHTQGTNAVEVSAKWGESEYDTRVKEIRKIANVKEIKLLKKTKHVVRSLREHVEVSERITSWKIKTAKARKILSIIDTSIIKKSIEMNIRIKFLIFGPGKNSKEYKTHRLALKKLIENIMHQTADFPEDLDVQSKSPVTKEYFLMMEYDYTIILMMSIGSVSEYSTFFIKPKVGHKIRLFVLKKHTRSGSYLTTGPIRMFRNHYRQVYAFSQPEDLLEKATKMIVDILEYRIMSE